MHLVNRMKQKHSFRRNLAGAAGAVLATVLAIAWVTSAMRPGMPDFHLFEAGKERKGEFFQYMQGVIADANAHVLDDRARLKHLSTKNSLGWFERRWLRGIAEEHGLDPGEMENTEIIEALLLRVDIIPVSLALAQAAVESGWGTSRFARDANNLFGEWCYQSGCGMVPRRRASNRSHEVEVFDSPTESVRSYLRNINTHHAYTEFRRIRKMQRDSGKPLSGLKLADGLVNYSERGEEYVAEIKQMIIANELEVHHANSDD